MSIAYNVFTGVVVPHGAQVVDDPRVHELAFALPFGGYPMSEVDTAVKVDEDGATTHVWFQRMDEVQCPHVFKAVLNACYHELRGAMLSKGIELQAMHPGAVSIDFDTRELYWCPIRQTYVVCVEWRAKVLKLAPLPLPGPAPMPAGWTGVTLDVDFMDLTVSEFVDLTGDD